jgi:methyl coenzyme M reductase system, component A2
MRHESLAPFIEIRDLTVRFGDVEALRNINLEIEEGESVGFLGKSGSGKSVLMHMLRGVETFPDTTGSVIYHVARCKTCRQVEPPSHWEDVMIDLTDRAVLLDQGEIKCMGDPKDVAAEFLLMAGELGHRELVKVGEPIIKVNDLAKRYISIDRGVVKAVDSVCFDVKEGEIFGLVGMSGGGKTTLSKMISGIITPTSGNTWVRVGDEWVDMNILGSNGRGRATKYIGVLHQEYTLYPSRTVIDNLTEAIGLALPFELAERKAIHTLTTVGFTDEQAQGVLDKMPDELSEGERHRIAMAQVLIKEPSIVILDEPTGTMDPITKIEVTKSILNAREELGETFVIVSHDLDFVKNACDRALLMRNGKAIFTGFPDEVLAKITEEEQKEMLESSH